MSVSLSDEDWATAQSTAARLCTELSSVVRGQDGAVRLVVAAAIAERHVLVEDRPGVGKTTLARALAAALGRPMSRIQGTADLLPTDITGVHVFQPNTGEWHFRPGPVLASIVLIDELNRATPKAQSALLEAMAEGQVTVDGETSRLPAGFFVIATQNPPGEPGVYPLVPAQLDRFAIGVSLGLPTSEIERSLLDAPAAITWPEPLPADALALVGRAVPLVAATPAVLDYLMDLVHAARRAAPTGWLSVRVAQDMAAVSRALGLIDGRAFLTPDDVQSAFRAAIRHRLAPGVDAVEVAGAAIDETRLPLHPS